jgi:hypothetical protein
MKKKMQERYLKVCHLFIQYQTNFGTFLQGKSSKYFSSFIICLHFIFSMDNTVTSTKHNYMIQHLKTALKKCPLL